MDKHNFFLIMTILGTVFLIATLYLGTSVTPEQAKDMRASDLSNLTSRQHLAINLAMLSFYGAIALASFEVARGFVAWLVS